MFIIFKSCHSSNFRNYFPLWGWHGRAAWLYDCWHVGWVLDNYIIRLRVQFTKLQPQLHLVTSSGPRAGPSNSLQSCPGLGLSGPWIITGIFQEHDRVGASRKFEQSNEMLPTAYLLLYMSVEAYKLLNLPLNFWKKLKKLIQKLFWRWFCMEKKPYVIQSSVSSNELIVLCPALHWSSVDWATTSIWQEHGSNGGKLN